MSKCNNLVLKTKDCSIKYKIPYLKDLSSERLKDTIKAGKPSKILEIGTGLGYSAAIMYEYLTLKNDHNFNITSIEKDFKSYQIARLNFKEFDIPDNQVDFVNDDAKNFISKEVGSDRKYDFIFLDGPKAQYINYYETLIEILEPGGTMFMDNMNFKGYIFDNNESYPRRYKTIVVRLKELMKIVKNDDRINLDILDIDDGIVIVKKK